MAALKLCVDRILPVSVFDAAKNGGTTPQISINITSLTQPEITADVVDMGAVEEEDDNA
jgi:metal-sulfur cluster biosynthetic enzyme